MVKNKKLNFKKVLVFCLIIFTLYYICSNYSNIIFDKLNKTLSKANNIQDNNGYDVIKLDNNKNYPGLGQEKIKNKDGYFTTFTTINTNKKTYIEYKQNGSASWSEKDYWGGTMEENGCGITAIATILSGYNKNYSPEKLRKKYYPVLDNELISDELSSTFKIKNSNFYYDDKHLSNDYIINHLKTNRPILICVWNKPTNNRWTTASHYMVLLATDENENVYVSNPNGLENSSKSSGWYNINEITPYLAKALFIEDYD